MPAASTETYNVVLGDNKEENSAANQVIQSLFAKTFAEQLSFFAFQVSQLQKGINYKKYFEV